MAATTQATGADRAAARLAEKLKANAALYAHLPAKPDSRQVKRRRALNASKAPSWRPGRGL